MDDATNLDSLTERALGGDPDAQDALFEALYPPVRKHLSFVLGFGAGVDDAVQETMLEIHRSLPKFRRESSVTTWALRIATRTGRRRQKRERLRQAREPADDRIDLAVFDVDQAQVPELLFLARALATLSGKKREAFVLMALFELSASEAGRALGVSANTAASRFRHARAELERIYRRDKVMIFDEPGAAQATLGEEKKA